MVLTATALLTFAALELGILCFSFAVMARGRDRKWHRKQQELRTALHESMEQVDYWWHRWADTVEQQQQP